LELDGSPRPRAAEFFAGIGLVRLAIEEAGFDVVFANDIDPMKYKIYGDNFSISDFVLGDIHRIAAESIPDCELFTASFPCNDLSVAGRRRVAWTATQSSAFWGLIRILRELGERRPTLVMLENVPGFLASQGGRDFARALTALNGLGYSVSAVMIDARGSFRRAASGCSSSRADQTLVCPVAKTRRSSPRLPPREPLEPSAVLSAGLDRVHCEASRDHVAARRTARVTHRPASPAQRDRKTAGRSSRLVGGKTGPNTS
jgi:hypothetical protein